MGADVKDEKIAISGWLEQTQISVYDFITDNLKKGIKNIFCTDISKDGLLEGTAMELYRNIIKKSPEINLIASGGVASMEEIEKLSVAGCRGVIIGKAIYEGKISMKELTNYQLKWL